MVQPLGPILKSNLLALAHAYCNATGASIATVSRYATNDSDTLTRLKSDRSASITLRKYDEAIAWFVSHWPANTKRPRIYDPSHWRKVA